MTPLDILAATGAFILLGIPFYWFVLHPFAGFWRKRPLKLAFIVAAAVGWGVSGATISLFFNQLFQNVGAPLWAKIIGSILLALEIVVLRQVTRAMGTERLIGKAEMAGVARLETGGVYAWLRHPSYAGMMATMIGICLLAWTWAMVAMAVAWFVLMRVMIALEERELIARFGSAYEDYRRRVPALLPIGIGRGEK